MLDYLALLLFVRFERIVVRSAVKGFRMALNSLMNLRSSLSLLLEDIGLGFGGR